MCLEIGTNRASSSAGARVRVRFRRVVAAELRSTPLKGGQRSQPTGGRMGDWERMSAGQRGSASGSGVIGCGVGSPHDVSRHAGVMHRPRRLLASWQVDMAMRMLRSRLAEPVTIAEIALACRLSPGYFIKAFSSTVGMAPYAWLIEQRLAMACSLIDSSVLPLAQIALDCGFSDQSHLTRTFVKRRGMTPARWRQWRREEQLALSDR